MSPRFPPSVEDDKHFSRHQERQCELLQLQLPHRNQESIQHSAWHTDALSKPLPSACQNFAFLLPLGFNSIYTLSRNIHQYSFYVQSMSIFSTPANSGWQEPRKSQNQSTSSCYSGEELACGPAKQQERSQAPQSCQLVSSITSHFKVFALCSNANYTLSNEKGKSAPCNISYCIARLHLILSDFIPNPDCVI